MFRSERLRADHDLSSFTCGNDELDAWLDRHALRADRSGTARTYVWVDEEDERVVAYFALAPHVVRREEVPRGVSRGAPDRIPAILLARLALETPLHGRSLGGALLADALEVALAAIRTAGGRLVVVDAIDEGAAAFYAHHGFAQVPGDPYRLVIKASVAARSLSLTWP